MTNKLDRLDRGSSLGDKQRKRAYLREFVPAMVLYIMAIGATSAIGRDTTPKKVLFLCATFVPVLLVAIAIFRHIRRLDDFEKLMIFRAMAIGFGLAMVTSIFFALASSAGLEFNPDLSAWAPFMIGMTAWGVLAAQHLRS